MIHSGEILPTSIPPLVDPAELSGWVIYDDAHLLVLDKPGWLVVHPSKNGPWSSLAGAVRKGMGLDPIHFVYRLDRETSGVIVLGKDDAGSRLQKAMGQRRIGKVYVALLEGEFSGIRTVDESLGQDLSAGVTVKQHVVPADSPGAQPAVTIFHSLLVREGCTLAGVEPRTGRKHQIRAHAEFMGHRVLGDKLYGADPRLYLEFAIHGWTDRHSQLLRLTRQALHCASIDLRPAGMAHVFRAPWPPDLARFAGREMGLSGAEAQLHIDRFAESQFAI